MVINETLSGLIDILDDALVIRGKYEPKGYTDWLNCVEEVTGLKTFLPESLEEFLAGSLTNKQEV